MRFPSPRAGAPLPQPVMHAMRNSVTARRSLPPCAQLSWPTSLWEENDIVWRQQKIPRAESLLDKWEINTIC